MKKLVFSLRIHRNVHTAGMLLHFFSSTKLPRNARGNIIRGKIDI